jgi:hypothetical protein
MRGVVRDVPSASRRLEHGRKRGAYTAQRRNRVAFLLQLRQNTLDVGAADIPQGYRADGRKDVIVEIETVDAHARSSEPQRRVRSPFRRDKSRKRHGDVRLALLLLYFIQTLAKSLERFGFVLLPESLGVVNAANSSVSIRHVLTPANLPAGFSYRFQTALLVTRSGHRAPFGSSSAFTGVESKCTSTVKHSGGLPHAKGLTTIS